MKKLIFIIVSLFSATALFGQQMPISENYFLDKYSLAPSYAGNFNPKYLFMGYRSDWSGIDGGPQTLRLSFSDSFSPKTGWGAKIIMDKAGIFTQVIAMGSYSYKVKVADEHFILFGLSAGVYDNTLNLKDYYNDPNYTLDPSLINADISSKLKFMSDFSAVYQFKGIDAGILFSNINFGDAKYQEVQLHYKPLANYQVHGSYLWKISDRWELNPLVILRGGKYIKSQIEIASSVVYRKMVWASLMFRDPGIYGIGLGVSIDNVLKVGYNFNIASSVAASVYNNHEITIGFNIFELLKPKVGVPPPRQGISPSMNR